MTPDHQSQIRTSLNNALTALLNHITIFFNNPPPRELPSHLLSPNPMTGISRPSTPGPETPQMGTEETQEWSFLPRHSSALATSKWGLVILNTLAKKVVEFLSWGEDTGDSIRIAMGAIRERLVRAVLTSWREDSENFYVLEDWMIDKSRGNGSTGWIKDCQSYQTLIIQDLENIVKSAPYPPF